MNTQDSQLRTDLLNPELLVDPPRIQIIVESQYNEILAEAIRGHTTSKMPAKDIDEALEIIFSAIQHREEMEHIKKDGRITLLYRDPDTEAEIECVAASVVDRQPGVMQRTTAHGAGATNKVRGMAPLLREEVDDPEAPGYKRAILGYYFDNTVQFTCWARTGKTANTRACWFEALMEEYRYFFSISGINRVLYLGRGPDVTKDILGNKIYGRPLNFFIRTERLRTVRQKTLEQIVVHAAARMQSV